MRYCNFLFFVLFVLVVSNAGITKEIDNEYESSTEIESVSDDAQDNVKKKFNYNDTYDQRQSFLLAEVF